MKMIADVDFNSDAFFDSLLLTMMTMMMRMMMIHKRDNPSSNEGEKKTAAKVLDDGDYSDYSTIEAMCVSW